MPPVSSELHTDVNSEAGAAESMLAVLSRLACCVPAGHMPLQRPLCSLVLHMAQQYPRLSHHVTGLMPLLSDNGQTGEIVNLAFQVLLSQLTADHLDCTFPSTQVKFSTKKACMELTNLHNLMLLANAQVTMQGWHVEKNVTTAGFSHACSAYGLA